MLQKLFKEAILWFIMETNMEKKLNNIELELYNLKSIIIKLSQTQTPKKLVKIKGMLKGINVNDENIDEAKNSLFINRS